MRFMYYIQMRGEALSLLFAFYNFFIAALEDVRKNLKKKCDFDLKFLRKYSFIFI